MFKFIEQIFVSTLMFFGNLSNVTPLECVSMNNQECKLRPEIININSINPIFYPFSIKTNKCSGNCNNINDPYARTCVPDNAKNLRFKVFNLMSRTNETRHIKQYETCKCICRLDAIICNNKQRRNEDKFRCECKELLDKGVSDKGFIWNSSNCECECDKFCNIGEYLDYSNCKCRKKLFDKLIEECTENIDAVKIDNENEHKKECSSCTVYIVLLSIIIAINIGVSICFVYYKYGNRNKYDLPY